MQSWYSDFNLIGVELISSSTFHLPSKDTMTKFIVKQIKQRLFEIKH